MLADVTVEEVVSVMKNDKGTGKKDIEKARIQSYLEIYIDEE